MVAAAERGHEERGERDDRDRDEDGEPPPARLLELTAGAARHGTP
jgi:hypothetical protein